MNKRIKNAVDEFRGLCKNFSIIYALDNVLYTISSKTRLSKLTFYLFERKKNYVLKYFENNYGDLIRHYQKKELPVEINEPAESPIWFFWYQSFDSAPKLVKACYKNIVRKNPKRSVYLISESNVRDYTDIPEYIFDKVGKQISYTHFSDIVRVALLEKWGGVWIDSTCFCSASIPDDVFKSRFYSCKTLGCKLPLPANSEWVTWFFATNERHSKLFSFLKEILYVYWEKENMYIDYLMTDYIIRLAYLSFEDVRRDIQSVPENNTVRNDFMFRFGEAYEANKLCADAKNWIYKLSYKKDYQKEINGKKTYFGMLVSGEL